ncbi:MAG TPA: glycosyltransferase [Ferruginibacter sp.]|jgi:glycosyltransferase involved in cell wall biosynthesis|nr:glycosyltransferase [Ferruginibacter sp.]
MTNKPEIIFAFPALMGGVASFNYNIINNSRLIKQVYSKVILIRPIEDKRPLFLDTFIADEVVTFTYSYNENQFYVKKRLNELLGQSKGAIVTDNFLTIATAKLFNNPKTVFHLLHDFFYVNQNIVLKDMIDVAIAHSSFFSDAVFASNPELFGNRNFYIPYGVKQLPVLPEKNNAVLNIVFLGRLDHSKGVLLLHDIEKALIEKGIHVNWTIIGKGILKAELLQQWQGHNNVSFFEPDSTDDVYRILSIQDIFVFPTTFEGTPVSILECLSNGVVTIVNDLPGGIRDIVTANTGFRCALNNISDFVNAITILNNDRVLLKQLQSSCYELSVSKYNIANNADNYFKLFLQYEKYRRPVKNTSVPLSFLDKAVFPNALVKFIRKIKGK